MHKLTNNIFGLKIRRTNDLIGEQGRQAFWQTGIELDAKLISIVVTLFEQEGQSSSEIAKSTGLMRQLVELRLKKLVKDGYLESSVSKNDARKRVFFICEDKKSEVEAAVNTMGEFEEVYEQLWEEIGVDLDSALVKLERALLTKPLLTRLCERFPHQAKKAIGEGYES